MIHRVAFGSALGPGLVEDGLLVWTVAPALEGLYASAYARPRLVRDGRAAGATVDAGPLRPTGPIVEPGLRPASGPERVRAAIGELPGGVVLAEEWTEA